MEKEDFLSCPVCTEVARDAMESTCCHNIFCRECCMSLQKSVCPKCRKEPFEVQESILARRMIGTIPYVCPVCSAKTTIGGRDDHVLVCSGAVRKCTVSDCKFEGSTDSFFAHLQADHPKDLLKTFDETASSLFSKALNSKNSQDKTDDPIITRKNQAGRPARLGASGKYYCGGNLQGACKSSGNFGCCNGSCGPTSGCNCRYCMILDIETRKLPKGFWLNREGAVCRKGDEGRVYCGRKMDLPFTDGYCGPTNGNNCIACQSLQYQLGDRYSGVNKL